jgi:hypothetical protein
MNNRWLEPLAITLVVVVWAVLHWTFRDVFIFHDSWNHNFPQVYEVTKNSTCGQFGYWLSSDTGTPTIIYAISFSLTQVFRILLTNWWACTHPAPLDAMFHYKVQIFVVYLGFALGMYVLGRTLFRQWLSALYLMAAALFAGATLDALHSDELAIIMFWVPWCAAALAMALRYVDDHRGPLYANVAALFICIQLLDMYPHIPALAAAYAAGIYAALWPHKAAHFVIRLWPRVWPAVIFVAVTAVGIYAIHRQIFDFQPQHSRTEITVRPSQFGATGFLQPSAFFGSLFPLTFTSAFDDLAWRYASRGFIYRLDVLLVYLGTLPLWFSLALIPRRGFTRASFGWLLFFLLVALTSLQPTGFYYAIYQLPFFNLFRSYIHFFDYAVISFLVVSAYGFDRIISADLANRLAILRSTILLASGLVVAGILALIAFVPWDAQHGPGIAAYIPAITSDAAIILAALGAIYVGTRRTIASRQYAVIALVVLVATQAFYLVSIYDMLGEPSRTTFARNKMDQLLSTPLAADQWKQPSSIVRVPCEKTTGCNLAQRPAASLKTDTSGSFFRDLQSPVLRKALPEDVKTALAGVTHPILWATSGITKMPSLDALDEALASYRGPPGELLTRTTYVVDQPRNDNMADAAPGNTSGSQIDFSDMQWAPNRISFRYRASSPGYANLSLTATPEWTASVSGTSAPIIRSYYNFVTVHLPSGEGEVVLKYHDPLAVYFFSSRTVLAFMGLLGLAIVAWRGLRQDVHPRGAISPGR